MLTFLLHETRLETTTEIVVDHLDLTDITLSEAEADEALRLLDAGRGKRGNLSKVHEVAFRDSMRRLSESERAANHEPC